MSWDKVDGSAHIKPETLSAGHAASVDRDISRPEGSHATDEELNAIFLRTYGKSKRDEAIRRSQKSRGSRPSRPAESPLPPLRDKDRKKDQLLLIDGYNVIFAWEELKELAAANLDSAREAFLEIMENYSSYKNIRTIAVFDSYKVSGGTGSTVRYGILSAIFTREAETADKFIEKAVYELRGKYQVRVVTSDRMVQMAALGDGALRTSSAEFYTEVTSVSEEIRQKLKSAAGFRNRPFEGKLDV